MALTISSVVTMCLLNSLLILLLCLLFRSDAVLRNIGPKCMIILFIVIIARMFLPFEFSYAYSVWIKDLLSPFRRLLQYQFLKEPFEMTVLQLFIFIWAAGIVVQIIRKLYNYKEVDRVLSLLPVEEWDLFYEKYGLNPKDFNINEKIKVIYSKQFSSPCLTGLKRCYLVLPEGDYTKEQLYYIILHEMMHAKNKDIIWKIGLDWLCVAFWWNPLFWYLRKELFQLIEMRNDILIAEKLSDEERIHYMECLKEMAMQLVKKDMALFSVAFSRNDLKVLKRRIKLIAEYKSFHRGKQILLSLLVGIVLFATSMVVLEPYSLKKVGDDGVPFTSDNSYLIRNGDGFDVYLNDEFYMTTGDWHPFRNLKIYNNIKEAQENE